MRSTQDVSGSGPDRAGSALSEEPVLAVRDIQGNVIPGFNTRHQVLVGVKFGPADQEATRRWLRWLLPSVSTLEHVNAFRTARRAARTGEEEPPKTTLTNVAFDAKGLALLAPEIDRIGDRPFKLGMGERWDLGDPKGDRDHEGHPSGWVVGGSPARTPEALLILGGDDLPELRRHAKSVREAVAAAGLGVPYCEEGHVLDGDVEHFGFRDGISQAGPRGRLSEKANDYLTKRWIETSDDRAKRYGRPGQPLVWPGQFVFGYPKQQDDDLVEPGTCARGGYDWMDNGSYLVFRRLRQDVAAFRRFVVDEAARLTNAGVPEMTPERLAALIVGRWPKGTPLLHNATGDDPDPMGDLFKVNHFAFGSGTTPVDVWDDTVVPADDVGGSAAVRRTVPGSISDQLGQRCPRFAHIRKVNPRDRSTDQGPPARTLTVAVLRRGITWGEPFPTDPVAQRSDDGQRGLLFLCHQTSIEKQFHVLNTVWMNDPGNPEGDSGHDLLSGQGDDRRKRSATLPFAGHPPIVALSEWVIVTGGGFFFSPSIPALEQFATPR